MNSSDFNCHLSTPKYRSKSESREAYFQRMKSYFNNVIKKKSVMYDGKPTRLVFSSISGDKCFNKFAAGSEESHLNKNGELGYDYLRIERFDWIFEILEKVDSCEKCVKFSIEPDKVHKNRININCNYKNYKIVLCLNVNAKFNTIVTAYYIRTKNERKNRKRKKAYKVCS